MIEETERVPRQMFGHLMTFVAVAELLNFRRAAEAVGRSQPSVTAQIRQLEEYLGIQLFHRTQRNVRLTPAGIELLDRAKKLLAETGRLITDVRSQSGVAVGQLSVSLAPTVAVTLLPRILRRFVDAYPGVRVLIREDLGEEMFAAVRTNVVDFGIGPYSRVPSSLEFNAIWRQDFFLIARRDHPIAERDLATVEDLAKFDLLCPARGSTAREVLDQVTLAAGFTVRPKYEALQYQTLFTLASAGFGATFMPKVSSAILEALGLIAVPFQDAPARSIGIIKRHSEALPPAAEAFICQLNDLDPDHRREAGLVPHHRRGRSDQKNGSINRNIIY